MKKFLCMFLCMVLAMQALTGCGGKKTGENGVVYV